MDYTTGREESQTIRILLADNDPMVRRGLRMRLALEPDIELVGETGSGPEALCMAQALNPDVVLASVDLSRMDGIEVTRQLRVLVPRAVVVMLTFQDDADTRARAEAAGVAALVEKRGGVELLLEVLRRLAERPARSPYR